MTAWIQRRASTRNSARVLSEHDLDQALALCDINPAESILAATKLLEAKQWGISGAGGVLWGFPADGPLTAICWAGANIIPVIPHGDPEAVSAFASEARAHGRRSSSMVGTAREVMSLWGHLRHSWPEPMAIRANQPLMTITRESELEQDSEVRLAQPQDFRTLFPACIAMFTEEVGYSPVSRGPAVYEQRLRGLIDQRRAFVRMSPGHEQGLQKSVPEEPRVIFKAEVGALTSQVAQLQGVWVNPVDRGTGIAAPGVAAVVGQVLTYVPVVSLYVNSYNSRALATYRRVGFEQVGKYATVLF